MGQGQHQVMSQELQLDCIFVLVKGYLVQAYTIVWCQTNNGLISIIGKIFLPTTYMRSQLMVSIAQEWKPQLEDHDLDASNGNSSEAHAFLQVDTLGFAEYKKSSPVDDLKKLPKWNYDRSSTWNAPREDNEVILYGSKNGTALEPLSRIRSEVTTIYWTASYFNVIEAAVVTTGGGSSLGGSFGSIGGVYNKFGCNWGMFAEWVN